MTDLFSGIGKEEDSQYIEVAWREKKTRGEGKGVSIDPS